MDVTDTFAYWSGDPDSSPWPLVVTAAGVTVIPPHSRYPVRGHPRSRTFKPRVGRRIREFQFVYITDGGGYFESDKTPRVKIQRGQVFILFPDILHRYAPDPGTGWTEAWIEVRGDLLARLCSRKKLSPAQSVIALDDNTRVIESIRECLHLLQHQPSGFEGLASAAALRVVAEICFAKLRSRQEVPVAEEKVRQARLALAGELSKPPSLTALARKLRISYPTLRRKFRHMTGMGMKEYHEKLRLRVACRLLAPGQLKLDAIAQELGYSSAFHLSKNFKKHYGIPPGEWLRRHSG